MSVADRGPQSGQRKIGQEPWGLWDFAACGVSYRVVHGLEQAEERALYAWAAGRELGEGSSVSSDGLLVICGLAAIQTVSPCSGVPCSQTR